MNKICRLVDCSTPMSTSSAKGLCMMHYGRLRANGDPYITKVVRYSTELDKIFASIIIPEDYVDDCWIWVRKRHKFGYGKHYWRKKYTSAHRALYKILVDDNIDGLDVDHLCRNPPCVNPNHMEAVTSGENTLRGVSPPAINKLKTHCKRGHKFTENNTVYNKKGNRSCRECKLANWRKHYKLHRKAGVPGYK